jgi:hypothetical protein
MITLMDDHESFAARRDARWGEWTGFAGPEGTGTSPLDQTETGTLTEGQSGPV